MKPRKWRLLPPLFLLFFYITSAEALQVKKIHPENGTLMLDDSRQVQLAGVHLAPEAYKSIAVLCSGKEIEIQEEKMLAAGDAGFPFVYLSVKTLEISFPFNAGVPPRSTKIYLNEMLLSSGLASVDETRAFANKETYLKLQEGARLLGEGIWSQELSVIKKMKSQ